MLNVNLIVNFENFLARPTYFKPMNSCPLKINAFQCQWMHLKGITELCVVHAIEEVRDRSQCIES